MRVVTRIAAIKARRVRARDGAIEPFKRAVFSRVERDMAMKARSQTLLLLALGAVFLIAGVLAAQFRFDRPALRPGSAVESMPPVPLSDWDGLDFDPAIANPDMTPEEVVEMQVTALRGFDLDPGNLVVCYSLASPSNRAMTGPLSRFAGLVTGPPYDSLISADSYQIGQAIILQGYASVLVTVLGDSDQMFAYRFYLAKQLEAPVRDCWMTDGVEHIPLWGSDEALDNAGSSVGAVY